MFMASWITRLWLQNGGQRQRHSGSDDARGIGHLPGGDKRLEKRGHKCRKQRTWSRTLRSIMDAAQPMSWDYNTGSPPTHYSLPSQGPSVELEFAPTPASPRHPRSTHATPSWLSIPSSPALHSLSSSLSFCSPYPSTHWL